MEKTDILKLLKKKYQEYGKEYCKLRTEVIMMSEVRNTKARNKAQNKIDEILVRRDELRQLFELIDKEY